MAQPDLWFMILSLKNNRNLGQLWKISHGQSSSSQDFQIVQVSYYSFTQTTYPSTLLKCKCMGCLFSLVQEWTSQFAAVLTGFSVHGHTLPGKNFSSIHPAAKILYTDFKQTLGMTYITGLLCVTLLKLIRCLGSLEKKKENNYSLQKKSIRGNQWDKFKRKILLLSSSIVSFQKLLTWLK